MSVNKRKRKSLHENKWSWTTCTKAGKHTRHLVLNARDLPGYLAFDLAFVTGSSVGNPTWLALLRHFLAFTSIRRLGNGPQASAARVADLGSIPVFSVGLILGRVALVSDLNWYFSSYPAKPGATETAGTGLPGVSILWLGEIASLSSSFYLSVAERTVGVFRFCLFVF